ncbi:hypothetical protein PIB30_059133 [Stylosanthes scabra]|uniref:Uncharacterized protein n=1 Tax=Stylosanthes scabra TaxID=79078 RepID=A0ABU6UIY2_9FABA|nr:hypothetical protein [Stylosanthes scabra]
MTFNSSQLDHRSSDRRTVVGYTKLTQGGNNQASGIEGLSGEARVHSNWGGLQEAGTQASNLNRFVCGSNRLGRWIQKMKYLLVAKTKFLNRFAILASRLELLDFEDIKNLHPRRVDSNREPRSRGACRANDSAYGNSGPSGVVSAVGSLFPRGAKTNVAAHGSGRGASCQRPGYQPRMVLRGSTNDGCPELVPDRSGLAIITDRMSSS